MRQYAGKLNRGWLSVLGVLLLLGGLYVVLASYGVLLGPEKGSWVDADRVGAILERTVVVVAVALLGVVIGLLALAWIIAQAPRVHRARPFRFHDDPALGLTLCSPEILSTAIVEDIKRLPSVMSAGSVLRGTAAAPELTMTVGVDDRADFSRLMQGIRSEVVENFTKSMGTPPFNLAVRLDVEPGKRSNDSVTL